MFITQQAAQRQRITSGASRYTERRLVQAVLGARPVRPGSRQKAPGPVHVRSIGLAKAGQQLLFFRLRSDDEETKG